MFSMTVRNVDEALQAGTKLLNEVGEEITCRGMKTLEAPDPVATKYYNPMECVCFHPSRSPNPFFHFFEALWILGGKEDVAYVAQFNPNMGQFSDDGVFFHGAYGHRLRYHHGFDQVEVAIRLLKNDETTRQVVLQIWSAGMDLGAMSKDIPCNDLVFLKVRNGQLHMRVCCRSNDMIWGAYGANAVQFPFLLEYLALSAGYPVGTYTQISDSFHVYTENAQGSQQINNWESLCNTQYLTIESPYKSGEVVHTPLILEDETKEMFDSDLSDFLKATKGTQYIHPGKGKTHFFKHVAGPLWNLWLMHKDKDMFEVATKFRQEFAGHYIPNNDWITSAIAWVKEKEWPF